jgi:hypothetical protein
MSPQGEITRLIADWQRGDAAAENALFELLYARLHSIALQCLRGEPLQTIGATALVHEAYMRFKSAENLEIANRAHFLALAARVMHSGGSCAGTMQRETARHKGPTGSCGGPFRVGFGSRADTLGKCGPGFVVAPVPTAGSAR